MLNNYTNITLFADDNQISLVPQTAWSRNAGSNSWYTTTQGANLTLSSIPANATAIYWNGFKSTGAGEYSICIDCSEDDLVNNNLSVVVWIDGHTLTADSAPQLIWSATNLSSYGNTSHILRIRNQIDERYNLSGQLNIDSLVITYAPAIVQINVPVLSQASHASNAGFKATLAIALLEAFTIIGLLAFIFLKIRLRKKRPFQQLEDHRIEFPPTAPLITHKRATGSTTISRDYDPYEELEDPSDMRLPAPMRRLRLQSNVLRVSSALSANSVFQSLAGMFPGSPGDDQSTVLSRTESTQSRATHVASYFDFNDPPHDRVPPSPTPPPLPRKQSSSVSPLPERTFSRDLASSPPPPTDVSQTFSRSQSASATELSKTSEGTSRNAVENGGNEREVIDSDRHRLNGTNPFARMASLKAEFVNPPNEMLEQKRRAGP